MLSRFLVADLDPAASQAVLPADEAHHLTRVLRLGVGDRLVVFDGRGQEMIGQVQTIARGAVTVSLLERLAPVPVPAVALTLVQAILKAGTMEDVIRDAVMVGVQAVQPVVSARTTVKHALLPLALERWRRIALASAKQCGRASLPPIHAPVGVETWIGAAPRGDAFLLVEPAMSGAGTTTLRALALAPAPASASLMIGPEGGWTERERDLALAAGCTPLSLGPLTLRAASVPLAATAALLALWEL